MSERVQKLLLKMNDLKIDAMLIGSKSNRLYMSGFTGSNAMLYISKSKQVIITDFRYLEQVKEQCKDFQVANQGTEGLIKTALKMAQEDGARYIGFESDHTNYTTYLELSNHKNFNFVPTSHIVEAFRQIKDEEEINRLRQAERIGDLAFSHIVSFITANYQKGLTENEVALELERVMRTNGASGTSFASIVAAGVKSALPHAEPGSEVLKQGDFVVIDFGCIYKGYCSDMTRTLVIGEATEKHKAIYDVVLQAQLAALRAIKPGMLGREVDQVARDIITKAGYGEYFGHGLGHSTGVDIHESPRFSPLDATVLKKGMIMTVEPGIYIPGFGGVRIEDLIVITDDGIENLTHSSKELIVIK
ncbi:M24 family metallopeptidase [Cellulosilyticum sp. I15G10I2]|uniref:M24 family metallopeptidase n=1 Tax=Cellulosilyticum sp. I15G10I2 TaxID=1892843 RepID=UPI00085C37F8|nr:Xaa-Pro peptidase family protein [Cellulosilyticum sp. I15G10I2]